MSLRPISDWARYLSPTGAVLLLVTLVTSIVVLRHILHSNLRKHTFPPGPPPDPIIGHLRHVPRSYPNFKFAEWFKTYGEIVYLAVLGKSMIIVSTVSAARELMETKGANNSDRPGTVYYGLMGWGDALSALPYGERFRTQRRLLQPFLSPQSVRNMNPIIQSRVHSCLQCLRDRPETFTDHIHDCVSSIVVMATYGYEFESDDDPRRALVERAMRMAVEGGLVGAALVDFLPILRHIPTWMPGAGFKRHALKTAGFVRELIDEFFNCTVEKRASGILPPDARQSLVYQLLDKYEKEFAVNPRVRADIRDIASTTYAGGVGTTEVAIQTFFLMMTLHPEFARRAQSEIDAAIGKDRLPTLDDAEDLPYVTCIMKEVFRWNPPLPLGVPHASIAEDTYSGMTIPARTLIIPNIWVMCRDEEFFESPHSFNPKRFMSALNAGDKPSSERNTKLHADDPSEIIFGFGRRICPGEHLAKATVWLTIACTLAEFDIKLAKDENGEEIVPEGVFLSGLTSHPAPFRCAIVPRARGCLDAAL